MRECSPLLLCIAGSFVSTHASAEECVQEARLRVIRGLDLWDTLEHATQLDHLTEMTVRARGEAAGADFTAIVNYPVGWTI